MDRVFLYYNPDLGPQYLRRLLGQMDLTFSRDYARQRTGWHKRGMRISFQPVRRHIDMRNNKDCLFKCWIPPAGKRRWIGPVAAPTR